MADVRQRLSWVRREMTTEHPEMDEAELDLITRRDSGSILMEEVMRLRGENTRLRESVDQLRRAAGQHRARPASGEERSRLARRHPLAGRTCGPKGVRNRATLAAEALLDGEAEAPDAKGRRDGPSGRRDGAEAVS